MNVGVDTVKAKLHTAALIRLLHRAQRNVYALTQEQRMVCLGYAGIHPSQLRKVLRGLELTHAAPFHDGAAGVVDSPAGLMSKQGPRQPGKDGLIHLCAVQMLE